MNIDGAKFIPSRLEKNLRLTRCNKEHHWPCDGVVISKVSSDTNILDQYGHDMTETIPDCQHNEMKRPIL